MENATLIILISAYILDLILGDPRWIPHPIVYFGKAISFFDKRWNKNNNRKLKGGLMTLILCVSVFIFFYLINSLLIELNSAVYILFNAIFLFFSLANNTLIKEGKAVFNALEKKGLDAGRKRLSWIVGRDTSQLTPQQIRTAVLETMSENLSDGVIAPLFYFAIFGVPGALCYKMINTLDSMVGYKNTQYMQFGFFSAKLDDVVNYIPSRITALLIACTGLSPIRSLNFIVKYGHQHASPNAGYPESALAGAINCRFGGPNIYHGTLVNKPYIGKQNLVIQHYHIKKTSYINHLSTFIMITMITLASIFLF